MTSRYPMSSRNPPVAQSTSGFPDDPTRSADFSPQPAPSAHRLSIGVSAPPAHLPSPPALLTSRGAFSPLSPSVRSVSSSASVSFSSRFQSVEKLSFQARLNCLYRQSENFLTTPKFYIFPVRFRRFAISLGRFHAHHSLSLRTLRPSREASFNVAFLGQTVRPENVEKLSFGPLSTACPATVKKSFPSKILHPHPQSTLPIRPIQM